MANKLLTISDITREALALLVEESQLLKACNRKYESRFAKSGAKVGASVDIRKPVKYGVTDGADLTGAVQDSQESAVTLSVDKRKTIGMQFSSEDLTLSIDDFSARFLKSAAARLARQIDLDIAQEALVSGERIARATIGDSVAFGDVAKANAQLSTQLAPSGDRRLFIDAFNDADIVNENKGLFQSAAEISKQYEKGVMGIAGGFKFVETENVPQIAFSGTITAAAVKTAGVNGDSVVAIDGVAGTATAVKKGQAFNIAGVYQVDPQTLESLPQLKTFIASADADIAGAACNVSIASPIYAIGYENKSLINVSALPAADAVITFLEGASAAGDVGKVLLGIAPDSIGFASVDLELPGVSKMEGRESYDGVSMRMVKTYDGLTDSGLYRLDVLYGVKTLRPENVVSIIGKV